MTTYPHDRTNPITAYRYGDAGDFLDRNSLNHWTQKFDNLSDIIQFQDKFTYANVKSVLRYIRNYQGIGKRSEFLGGFGDIQKAVQNLILGPPKIFKLLMKLKEEAERKIVLERVDRPRKRLTRNGEGDELDIHQVLSGNLTQAWEERKVRTRPDNPKVHIALATCLNSGISQERALEGSLNALILTDYLISAGINVKISFLDINTDVFARPGEVFQKEPQLSPLPRFMSSMVTVKQFGQRFNRRLLSSLGSVAFQRALIFPTFYSLPKRQHKNSGISLQSWKSLRSKDFTVINNLTGAGADKVLYIDDFSIVNSSVPNLSVDVLIPRAIKILKTTKEKFLHPASDGGGLFYSQNEDIREFTKVKVPRGRLFDAKKYKGRFYFDENNNYTDFDASIISKELKKEIDLAKKWD